MRTRPIPLITTLLLAAAALTAVQNARADDEPLAIQALREDIEVAFQARDVAALDAAHRALLAAAGTSGRAAYYAAYARFRQGLASESDVARARVFIDDCIASLRDYVARAPADAEARALLGSCYGVSTRYHRLGMASRGLEARRHIAAARDMAPANPWVTLQDALADYSTPRLFGGDPDLAVAKLERATGQFATEMAAGSRFAAWGAAEAWRQLGAWYRERGRADEARAALAKALALAPTAGPRLASL